MYKKLNYSYDNEPVQGYWGHKCSRYVIGVSLSKFELVCRKSINNVLKHKPQVVFPLSEWVSNKK